MRSRLTLLALVSDCSVVLIAPDLALTTGDCADTFADAIVTAFVIRSG